MDTLASRLRAKLEFEPVADNPRDVELGRSLEHTRTAPIVSALIECYEALECNETFHRLGGIDDCEPCKAKRKLEQLLAGGDK